MILDYNVSEEVVSKTEDILVKLTKYNNDKIDEDTKQKPNDINNNKEEHYNAIGTNDFSSDLKVHRRKNVYGTDYNFKRKIVWKNAIGFIVLHLLAFYGYFLAITEAKFFTSLWAIFVAVVTGQGVTAGAHRLWAHRTFKVSFAAKIVLLILQTISGQNCLWVWVRDHRQHHRYSDTDADPHNAKRGFFFSHIGWLMSKKHPMVIEAGRSIDMSDLEADPWVMFQKKYYKTLYTVFAILIPVAIPHLLWSEDLRVSFFVSYLARYIVVLHITWSVNSVAHLYGTRPYDKLIIPVESRFVSIITNGEGWHNYHHTFPWDYRAGEWGGDGNVTSYIIEILRDYGFAYDLKKVPQYMIENRANKRGDGSYNQHRDKKYLFESAQLLDHLMSDFDK